MASNFCRVDAHRQNVRSWPKAVVREWQLSARSGQSNNQVKALRGALSESCLNAATLTRISY